MNDLLCNCGPVECIHPSRLLRGCKCRVVEAAQPTREAVEKALTDDVLDAAYWEGDANHDENQHRRARLGPQETRLSVWRTIIADALQSAGLLRASAQKEQE